MMMKRLTTIDRIKKVYVRKSPPLPQKLGEFAWVNKSKCFLSSHCLGPMPSHQTRRTCVDTVIGEDVGSRYMNALDNWPEFCLLVRPTAGNLLVPQQALSEALPFPLAPWGRGG